MLNHMRMAAKINSKANCNRGAKKGINIRKDISPFNHEMISIATAAIAALFIMFVLLISTQLNQSTVDVMKELYEPKFDAFKQVSAEAPPPTATPTQVPDNISIHLVDIDSDVDDSIHERLSVITAEVINRSNLNLSGTSPKILIYHTHNTEAYSQTEQYTYVESGDWRTEDNTRNVIAVGEELARILREDYGISVIHATAQHERPLITTAYSRSLETMEYYKQLYPSIEMFIDLHRDGYTVNGENTDYVVIDGERVARMMFVVGTGEGATGSGSDPMPDFESNYALALNLTETMLSYNPKLMRNVRVKTSKYNQHVSSKCLLVEVGHNANTLEEALNAVKYLARAIAEVGGIEPVRNLSLIP